MTVAGFGRLAASGWWSSPICHGESIEVLHMHYKPRKLPVFFSSCAEGHRQCSWQPAADVYRTRAGWLVKLDVAGVRLEDVHTEVTETEVQIKGCRRDFQAVEGCRHYSMEISYNRFQRFIRIPGDLTGAKVRVECSEGILLVELITEENRRE